MTGVNHPSTVHMTHPLNAEIRSAPHARGTDTLPETLNVGAVPATRRVGRSGACAPFTPGAQSEHSSYVRPRRRPWGGEERYVRCLEPRLGRPGPGGSRNGGVLAGVAHVQDVHGLDVEGWAAPAAGPAAPGPDAGASTERSEVHAAKVSRTCGCASSATARSW